METPRQRQVAAFEERFLAELLASQNLSARQRRREAKCKLVGHRDVQVDENTNECLRCGRLEDA